MFASRQRDGRLSPGLLDLTGSVAIEDERAVVTVDQRAHHPLLAASRLADTPTAMPWFGGKLLCLRFA